MLARYSELQERFRRLEGYSIDLKITTVLRGLGFSNDDLEKPTETFSGGWQMRIALAKLLLGRPGLLLLDEPTNHLDLEARNWLEEYLADYPARRHPRLPRPLLPRRGRHAHHRHRPAHADRLSGELQQLPRTSAKSAWSGCASRSAIRTTRSRAMKAFIDRFRYQATKAAQVQSRIKMLDKIVPIEIPPERKRVHFTFPACAKSGRTVLELRSVREGLRPAARLRRHQRSTSSAAIASPSSGRTAPASRR